MNYPIQYFNNKIDHPVLRILFETASGEYNTVTHVEYF